MEEKMHRQTEHTTAVTEWEKDIKAIQELTEDWSIKRLDTKEKIEAWLLEE